MGLLSSILASQGGNIVGQISSKFGLDPAMAESAVRSLIPAISQGIQNNTSDKTGLESLVSALSNGNHQSYVDDPDSISDPATTADGNSILGHILGSKEISRNVADEAAAETGVSSSTLKKMLPILASVAMGVMSRESSSSSGNKLDIGGLLSSFIGSDDNGSVAQGLLGMAKKLF
ncbi:MAG: DUF937 domain-containing protein [Candidatus Sabulitectum sp.]|nr:DUF937 domain-containing protein [Candidatus Sabulitectum sp.]